MTPLTPYSEALERARSVLVFFATTGAANAAVLAELESEVRAAVRAARGELVPFEDVLCDLERLAALTLPPSSAATATRLMNRWAVIAFERSNPRRAVKESGEMRS